MKILIHGRKNGYTVLYPKPTPTEFYSFARDIQSISANNYDVYYGKTFYSLAFVDGDCIFTKYVIGDDVERGQLGEIGISVFIPNTQKISGADVKNLLDELINTYCRNYIFDNKLNEPKNGFDWLLFTSLANGYDAKLVSRSSIDDNVTTGTKDPAYHYYKSDSELIEHLEKPFQEEYSDFRQILFIESNLQGAANPLNVIKNSGEEVNPDLKNEYYYLNNYNSNKGIKITANGKPRSDEKGNNQIRAKWQVEIKYSKDYYIPIVSTGSISNPASDIHKYLEINGSNIKIKYDAFLPDPETKTITFDVVTKKDSAKVPDAEIQILEYQDWQRLSEYTFKAEELGKEYKIFARKGKNLYSDVAKITPKDFKENSLTLPLIEKRVVKIVVTESEGEKNNIFDFKVWISDGKYNTQKVNEVTFAGDEIDNTWNITVEKEGYTRSSSMPYYPKNGDSIIYFELNKASRQTTHTNTQNGQDSLNKESEKPKSFATIAKTFFSKPAVIATSIVSALILGVGIWVLCNFLSKDKSTNENPLNKGNIEMYVEGDSISLNTLNDYKENWKLQEQNFITKSGGGMFGGDETVDSAKWKSDWQPVYESIERTLTKRNFINNKNLAELKNLRYSNAQLSFKTAIEKIDSTKYAVVMQKLGDVSALTLTQIAKKIDEILKPKESEKQEQLQEPKKEKNKTVSKNEEKKQELKNAPSAKTEQQKQQVTKPANQPTQQTPDTTDNTSKIIQYLRGSELDEAKLNEYKNTKGINQNLKNSIQLCLDFWVIDGSGTGKRSKTYWNFRDKINTDNNFNNSKLKAFLDKVCDESNPSYFKIDKKKGLK